MNIPQSIFHYTSAGHLVVPTLCLLCVCVCVLAHREQVSDEHVPARGVTVCLVGEGKGGDKASDEASSVASGV